MKCPECGSEYFECNGRKKRHGSTYILFHCLECDFEGYLNIDDEITDQMYEEYKERQV